MTNPTERPDPARLKEDANLGQKEAASEKAELEEEDEREQDNDDELEPMEKGPQPQGE